VKILSANLQLQGKFWNLKIEVFNKSGKCIQSSTVSLAALFTSYSDPTVINISLDSRTLPSKVTAHLSFKTNVIKSDTRVKLLPLICIGSKEIDMLEFMYLKGENINCNLSASDIDLFSSNLSDYSRSPKRVSCCVNREKFSNKIGDYICESVKKEILLVFFESEVILKSEINKRTKEMIANFECFDQTILDLLVSLLIKENSIVRLI